MELGSSGLIASENAGITKEILEDRYVLKQLSTIKIAKEFNVSQMTINRALESYGIPRRLGYVTNDNITDNQLRTEYINNKKSILTISKEYSMTRARVTKRLRNLNIDIRNRSQAALLREVPGNLGNFKLTLTKEELEELYIRQRLPSTKIGEVYGVNSDTVVAALKRYDIPIRTLSERSILKWEDEEAKANQLAWRRSPEGRQALSDRMQERMANGYCPCSSNSGYYTKQDNTQEHYCSLLELAYMLYLDNEKLTWTKNHGIKISYVAEVNDETCSLTKIAHYNYIPDFLVENQILVETKGWEGINYQEKFDAAMDYCDKNSLVYDVVWHNEWIEDNIEWYEAAKSMHV